MDELQKLYDVLVREGKYTKSFEEFQTRWGQDQEYKDKVYDVVSRDGLYTKDKNSFFQKYSAGGELISKPVEEPVNLKKNDLPIGGEDLQDGFDFSQPTSEAEELPIERDKRVPLLMPKEKAPTFPAYKYIKEENIKVAAEEKDLKLAKEKYTDIYDKQLNIKGKANESSYLNERLASINKSLINREEEYVVPEMQYQFGDLGFKFEEAGATGDYMNVTAPNGKKIEISLDNISDLDSEKESIKLKSFIEGNTPQKGLFVLEQTIREQDKKFNSQKQVDEEIKKINNDLTALNTKQKNFILEKSQYEANFSELESTPASQRNTPEFNNKLNQLEQKRASLNENVKSILSEEETIKSKGRVLDKAVGKYSIAKAKQGTWGGGIWDSFLGGFGKIGAALGSTTIDIMTELQPTGFGMSPKDLKDVTIDKAIKLGITPPTANQSIDNWKKTLTDDQLDDWEDEIDDYIRKSLKKDILPSTRIGLKTVVGDPDTTIEWENLKKQGFWGGAVLGLAESIPAMIGGTGPAGFIQRTALMYGQISDGLAEEMENDPDFANISENEKTAITLPIGIVSAVLEAYGLRNVVASKGIINGITMSVLGRVGKGVTAKSFRELVENEVESRLAKGLLIVGAAGLAEGETGALQEVAETTFKAIYNEIKEKDMFQTPASALDFVENIAVAGAQEAVGGFIMGVPSAVSTAYSKKGFLKMNDETFKMFENIANDETMQTAYVTSLKEKVSKGLMTIAEAKENLNDYRNSVGLYRQIPDGLNTNQKKEAMNLLKEKRDLEQYTEGKDPAMVTKQKNRINEINEILTKVSEQNITPEAVTAEAPEVTQTRIDRIAEIETTITNDDAKIENPLLEGIRPLLPAERVKLQTELETLKSEQDAIQKQTAGQVPVLTEAGFGEEVPGGLTQTESEIVAQEGVQEEVTKPQQLKAEAPIVSEEAVSENIEQTPEITRESIRLLTDEEVNPLYDEIPLRLLPTVEGVSRQDAVFEAYFKSKKKNTNPELVKAVEKTMTPKVSLETQLAPEEVAVEEQFVSLTSDDIEFNKRFSRDEASDVVESEKEGDNGRSYTYISEVETPVYDADGEQIGYLVKMVDDDKNLSFEARNDNGSNLSKNEEGFSTLREAEKALLDNHNKSKKKEFDRNAKAKAKEKAKADAKAAAKKAKAETKKPAAPVKAEPSTETEEEQVARMMELFQKGAEATTDSGISITNKSQINSIKGKVTDKLKLKVIESAQKALKTLRSVLPNFDIIIHENEGSYNAAMIARNGKPSEAGNFSIDKKGSYSGRIDINLERANARTVAHEVAHGIMLKVFGDTPALFKNFRDRISTVLKESANQKLIEFAAQYEGDVTYEEYLAELIGTLEQQEENISPSVFQKIALIINSVISKISKGTFKPFEDVKNTKEIIEFFSGIAQSIRQGEEIGPIDSMAMEEGVSLPIGKPVIISKSQIGERVSFSKNAPPLSFVTEADKIDINALIDEIVEKKQKVWFWMADQLGRGNYYDSVINKEHYLDAGPSFALDPENRSKGILWASGLREDNLSKQIAKADYIFFISGSPEVAKLFNRRVLDLVAERINKTSNFNDFRNAINNFKKETKEFNTIKNILSQFNSFKELAADKSSKRKEFLLAINEIRKLKTTPPGSLKELLESFNAFVDYNDLRDGFYRNNNFTQNDIMLVGKPTGLGGKAPHSTYEFAILGEVVGVPDTKIDSWNIMPQDTKDEYIEGNKFIDKKTGKEKIRKKLDVSQKTKIVAAETGVIRELESQVTDRVKELGDLLGFDLGKPVSKSQISNTPLPEKTKVANGFDVLKKKFGETSAKAIRENIPFALEYPNEFAEFISKTIPVKEDVAFMVKNLSGRLDGLFRLETDKNIETIQVKNKTPEELSKEAGYVFHRPESMNDVLVFKKDFAEGEVLCTIDNYEASGDDRTQSHFVFWLRRNDAESVLHVNELTQKYLKDNSEGSALWRKYLDDEGRKMPDGSYDLSNLQRSRQDPYGTSSMSVQIQRGGSLPSIKNRYNHKVLYPDSTFENDLNNIVGGLQEAVYAIEGVPKQKSKDLSLPNYTTLDSKGRFFKYDQKIDDIYVSQHGYVEDGDMTIIDKSYQRMIDNYVFDSKNNKVSPISIGSQLIVNINKISFEKNKITVDSENGKFEFELVDGLLNKLESNTKIITNDFLSNNITLESISLPNVENIGYNFLNENLRLNSISLPNVKKIGYNFLYENYSLTNISLPNVKDIGINFLRQNTALNSISLPNVENIGYNFLIENEDLESISFPNVKNIGANFLPNNYILTNILLPNVESIQENFVENNTRLESISLPNVKFIGSNFLRQNIELESISLPNVKFIGRNFLEKNVIIKSVSLPNVTSIDEDFLSNNKRLENISLPNVTSINDYFLAANISLNSISLPNVEFIGMNFLRYNIMLDNISLPNVQRINSNFLRNNQELKSISLPNVERIGENFLYDNEKLKTIELPKIETIGNYFMINNESVRFDFSTERPPISKSQISSNNEINAAVNNFRTQGFSESAIKAFLIQQGYSATEANQIMNIAPIQEEFNSVMKKVDAFIARQKGRGIEDSKIPSNIDTYIRKQDEYLNANDAQKKIIEREARAKMGAAPKRAVSIGRVLGALKDITNISRAEKLKIISQIRQLSKDAAKDLVKEIREMESSGKITLNQAANIIAKTLNINPLNEASVSNFVDYMAKVFANAEYVGKMTTALAQIKNAKTNIKTKIGVAQDLFEPLNQLLSINPTLIPLNQLEKYLGILKDFSARKAVLSIDDRVKVLKQVNEILDEINNELSAVDVLADRFNNYNEQVFKDGSLDYAATIKKMIDNGLISTDEADLMKKYKSEILPQVEATPLTEEEIAEQKKEQIKILKSLKIDNKEFPLPSRDEKEDALNLAKLIKELSVEDLMNISLTDLKNIIKVIDNINNGYLPHYAKISIEKLNAIKEGKVLSNAIEKAKPLSFSKLYSRLKNKFTRKGVIDELIRATPLYYIGNVFGDFKTRDIFNSLFEKSAQALSIFNSELKRIEQKIETAQNKVLASFNQNSENYLMSKFRMTAYMLQREYESNIGKKGVKYTVSQYLEETIKHIGTNKSIFKEADAEKLQKILKEVESYIVDGKIDLDKFYKTFNSAEKNAINVMTEINKSLGETAAYTAAVIRGDKVELMDNYFHHNVLHEQNPMDATSAPEFSSSYSNSMRPSTKAKSLIERTDKLTPLNFDLFTSTYKGAKFVLLDYNLTSPIRTAKRTLIQAKKNLEKKGLMDKKNVQIYNAIDNAYEEALQNVLTNAIVQDALSNATIDFIQKQGYRAVLAGTTRFQAELLSNITNALLINPSGFIEGIKHAKLIASANGYQFMKNAKAKQLFRLYASDALSGKMVDPQILKQTSGIKGSVSKGALQNRTLQIYNLTLKKYVQNPVEYIADTMLTTPDKVVSMPLWFGSFMNEFKKITGEEVNQDMMINNDLDYMQKYADAIEQSTRKADQESVYSGASNNEFMGILKGKIKPNQALTEKVWNNFNSFMTNFMNFDYAAARSAVYNLFNEGYMTKKKAAAVLAGLVTRSVIYQVMVANMGAGVVGAALGLAFDWEDEEEVDEKSFFQKLGRGLANVLVGYTVGRNFGNAVRGMINYGVEQINEEYLDFLRNGKYDFYKDNIAYSYLNFNERGDIDIPKVALNMAGAYTPAISTAVLIGKNFGAITSRVMGEGSTKKEPEAIRREDMTVNYKIPLEVAGNLGLIPIYKDIKKAVNDEIYKDLRKAANTSSSSIISTEGYEKIKDLRQLKEITTDEDELRIINKKIIQVKGTKEQKKVIEESNKRKKERKDRLLYDSENRVRYDNESEMKRYNQSLYNERFGVGSDWYEKTKYEQSVESKLSKINRKREDEEYQYTTPPKKK